MPSKTNKAADKEDVEAKINAILVEGEVKAAKMEVDYSETTAKAIPEAEAKAKGGDVEGALESLFNLEKQTRTGGDMHSTSKILVAFVKICSDNKKWEILNENLIALAKKRGQLKAAVGKMVREAFALVTDGGKLPDKKTELALIETLRTITAGKIFVEVERARITKKLADMQEADGEIEKAAKTMQELQVETYGSMDRKEKVELILEQMRLCLATRDYIRTQIISKKISVRYFDSHRDDAEVQKLKLLFYKYMVEMNHNEGTYLDICRHYRSVYDTKSVQDNETDKLMTMRKVALYIVLSPFDNEQSDLIHRILAEKVMEDVPVYKSLLEQFTNMEIIDQQRFNDLFEAPLRMTTGEATGDLDANTEGGKKRWADLKNRIVEHNIRIIAKYYTRITLKRMSDLLGLTEAESEDQLSKMVVKGIVEAKTDRLDGIVHFKKVKNPNDLLNEWSHNVSHLMELVQKTTHLINKEEMVHKHLLGAGGKVEAV